MYVCIKLFDMNDMAKLETCLQSGSQNKIL